MKNLKAKMKKKAGFTLIEMLIVVAIIAILVAISIPLVGTALEGARDATDQANMRAAKMAAVAYYLKDDSSGIITDVGTVNTGTGDEKFNAYYDAEAGKLVTNAPTKGYGKCKNVSHLGLAGTADNTDKVIKVSVSTAGVVDLTWEAAGTVTP